MGLQALEQARTDPQMAALLQQASPMLAQVIGADGAGAGLVDPALASIVDTTIAPNPPVTMPPAASIERPASVSKPERVGAKKTTALAAQNGPAELTVDQVMMMAEVVSSEQEEDVVHEPSAPNGASG
jgi:hypothetical protein